MRVVYADLGGVNLGGVYLCCIHLSSILMGGVGRLSEPETEGVENYMLHSLADSGSINRFDFGLVGYMLRTAVENQSIKSTRSGIYDSYTEIGLV